MGNYVPEISGDFMGEHKFYTVRGFEKQLFDNKLVTGTMEDYIEMIYRCKMEGLDYIRLNKLAELLNVKDSTASKMMTKLKALKLVDYEKYGIIVLTDFGVEVGRYLYERHNVVEKFLKLICGEEEAFIETELIEHNLSSETVENLTILNDFIDKNDDIKERFYKFKSQYYEKE